MKLRRSTRPPRRSPRWLRPARYTKEGLETLGFVLTETLVEGDWSTGAAAYVRYWDPAADGGKGDFVTSEDEWRVYDRRRVGYHGEAGSYGAAEVRPCQESQGFCGVICDLHCP